MDLVAVPEACWDDAPVIAGMAPLVRTAYRQGDLRAIWSGLMSRYEANPRDAAACMDMSVILQVSGQRDQGLELQRAALQVKRCYRRVHGRGTGLRILVLAAEGDFMANTPFDFLFEGSRLHSIHLLYRCPHPAFARRPRARRRFYRSGRI